jgi:uncharacterized protein (TIGR04255 family)
MTMAPNDATTREIYVRPPLEIVAFELRIPHSLPLAERAAQTAVWDRLRDVLPLTEPQSGFQLGLGPGSLLQSLPPLRLLDRSRTISVVVAPDSVVLENTGYRTFAEFCGVLREVLAALPAQDIAGFTRIGLRYIDEIRVPGVSTPEQWRELLAPALLAPVVFTTEGFGVRRLTGELDLVNGEGYRVVIRYGTFPNRIVNVEGPLQTRTTETDAAFVIDLDSYWEAGAVAQEMPRFSIDEVINTTARLRTPIHELFEQAITDELRHTFREEAT